MKSFVLNALVGLFAIVLATPAFAYNSVIQTGDVVDPGGFQAAIVPQYIINRYQGVGLDALLDVGIDNGSSARGLIGIGNGVDFEVGGLYKYVPFPDTERQPAIGGEAGVVFARTMGKSEIDFRFHPFISKKLETEIGDVSPYAALPIGLELRDGQALLPIQLALGGELRPISIPSLSFFLEAGGNVYQAFGYISGAVAWRFDEVAVKRPVKAQ